MTTSTQDGLTYHSGISRGCGTARIQGGLYAECGLSENGVPLESFMFDPAILVPESLDLNARGVQLLERDGVWHLVDHVGSQHYPNVADFVEEVRAFGLSRRLPTSLDFAKLSAGSRILLCHSRAHIANWREYRAETADATHDCPKTRAWPEFAARPGHAEGTAGPCSGLWWEDVEGGEPVTGLALVDAGGVPDQAPDARRRETRLVRRAIGGTSYAAQRRPDGVTPKYHEAFFLSMPLTRIAAVRHQDGQHVRNAERARAARGIPVTEVDE